MDAATRMKKREVELKMNNTRDLRRRVEKYTEFEGGIFEHLL
jgi:hypothetical protein